MKIRVARTAGIGALALALIAACRGTPETGSTPVVEPEPAPELSMAEPERGAALYATHCAVCHGAGGAGDGPAYPWLFPPPRDFSSGRFRLVSTLNGVPTDDDLIRTLERGMPGSAMPAWNWLPGDDLESLARHVRKLAADGLAHRLRDEARAAGDGHAMRTAGIRARERTQPGPELTPIGNLAADEETLAHGRRVYSRECAGCHGSDGTGDSQPRLDDDGTLNWPRDFTAGFMKGRATPDELSWRIRAGIPGTAMKPFSLPAGELEALVAYVDGLIPDGSDDRLVHERRTIPARRTKDLPTDAGDEAWSDVEWQDAVLSPLHWSERAVLGASVAAFHDGERVAVALRWSDATAGQHLFTDLSNPDAAALQFSTAQTPPLFGMGSEAHPTNIWHWKALRLSDVAGRLDLLERRPHAVGEPFRDRARPDALVYDRELATPPASDEADDLQVEGVGRPITTRAGDEVDAAPLWIDGQWTVVFTRGLEPREGGEIALVPGSRVELALAVWNGAAGDRRGQKSISIWHELAVED